MTADAPLTDRRRDTAPPGRRPQPRRRRALGTALVCLVAVVGHLALQTSMLLARPDFSWEKFRGFFPFDQLSYLSVVVDGSRGDVAATEPFTGTGVDYYPHAYYLLLGAIAWLTGASPVPLWQVGGLVAQGLLVAGLAAATIAACGRLWTGCLTPLPFLVGTLSSQTGGGWYTALHQHAVLWGAYAVLFTLNGESVALCLGALSLLALFLVADARVRPRGCLPLALVSCLVLGALSAVQTYSFLAAVYLAAFVAAAWALVRSSARLGVPLALLSVALLVTLWEVGPAVADAVGPLGALVLGLLPAAPGLVVLLAGLGWRAAACVAVAAAGAAPQILWTVHGVVTGDPFLVYRQASTGSSSLGVGILPALTAAAVPLTAFALLLIGGIVRRRPLWTAVSVGALPAWALLATNDRWGAEQEPYRLWIDSFTLLVTAGLPVVVQAAVEVCSTRTHLAARLVGAACVVAVLSLVAASLEDFISFWRYGRHDVTLIDFRTSQADAIAALAGPGSRLAAERGLRLPDPCLDPFTVKTRAELPTAFYNYGMAWPAHERAMARLMAARTAGALDVVDARAGGVSIVLTDSRCSSRWPTQAPGDLHHVASRAYRTVDGSPARVDAWRLRAP